MKRILISLCLFVSSAVYSWEYVYLVGPGGWYQAVVPVHPWEYLAVQSPAAIPHQYQWFNQLRVAYTFHQVIPPVHMPPVMPGIAPQPRPVMMISGGACGQSMPVPPQNRWSNTGGKLSSSRVPVTLPVLYNIPSVRKHCKSYAFNGHCFKQHCPFEPISKSDVKHRMVCINHVLGKCFNPRCVYHHLTAEQAEQLWKAKFEQGLNLPAIICDMDHTPENPENSCPYLHFQAPDDEEEEDE